MCVCRKSSSADLFQQVFTVKTTNLLLLHVFFSRGTEVLLRPDINENPWRSFHKWTGVNTTHSGQIKSALSSNNSRHIWRGISGGLWHLWLHLLLRCESIGAPEHVNHKLLISRNSLQWREFPFGGFLCLCGKTMFHTRRAHTCKLYCSQKPLPAVLCANLSAATLKIEVPNIRMGPSRSGEFSLYLAVPQMLRAGGFFPHLVSSRTCSEKKKQKTLQRVVKVQFVFCEFSEVCWDWTR